jgi:hypothetical protein
MGVSASVELPIGKSWTEGGIAGDRSYLSVIFGVDLLEVKRKVTDR